MTLGQGWGVDAAWGFVKLTGEFTDFSVCEFYFVIDLSIRVNWFVLPVCRLVSL